MYPPWCMGENRSRVCLNEKCMGRRGFPERVRGLAAVLNTSTAGVAMGSASESEDAELERGKALMKGDTLVIRFCLYGFLKNLKFFEPYLWIVLVEWGLSLGQIGMLVSVEKITCYLFELPSGYLADRWGMRKELCLCFVFYIIAFVLYYFGRTDFRFLLGASFLYGLGEAMRSGTHKAMVLLWLQRNDLMRCKSYLYGRTRSWSLVGSGVSAVLSIFIMLLVQSKNQQENIFIFSVLPYVADLVMVASYPSYMDFDEAKQAKQAKKAQEAKQAAAAGTAVKSEPWYLQPVADMRSLLKVVGDPVKRRCLFSSCSFMSYHSILKHFIQAVVLLYGAQGFGYADWEGHEWQRTLLLGITYGVFYFSSAPVTKKAYLIQRRFSSGKVAMDVIQDAYGLALIIGALLLWLGFAPMLPVLYIALYACYNLFHPIRLSTISDLAGKELRATLLSADSLLETLFVSVGAPLAGLIAETLGTASTFAAIGCVGLVINHAVLAERGRCCGSSKGGRGASNDGAAGQDLETANEEREGLLVEETTSGDDTDDEKRKGVEKARD